MARDQAYRSAKAFALQNKKPKALALQTKKAREADKPPGPWVVAVCWTRSRCDRRLARGWTIGAGARGEPATTTAATHAGRVTNHDALFYSLREPTSSFSVNWNDATPLPRHPDRYPAD